MLLAGSGDLRSATPTRSPRCLSAAEREEISRSLAAGESMLRIAKRLGPHRLWSLAKSRAMVIPNASAPPWPSGACREAKRPKVAEFAKCHRLADVVEAKLSARWSSEQISD